MKKFFAVLCSAAMMLSSASFAAYAEDTASESSFSYELNKDGTVMITGTEADDSSLIIPSEIDGKKVTAVKTRAFAGMNELKSVIIPASVTSIGDLAFTACPNLSLIFVDPSNSVYKTVDRSLYKGDSLVVYAGENDAVLDSSTKSVAKGAFLGKENLTSVKLSEKITDIGDFAFSGCTALAEIDLPDSVTSLGKSCFLSCTSLHKATLGSIEKIPEDCFLSCTSLHTVDIPETVTYISSEAFFSCSELTGIYIPESVKTIEGNSVGRQSDSIITGGKENISNFRITGEKGSAAQKYAESYGIYFTVGEIPLGDIDGNYIINAVDASAILTEYVRAADDHTSALHGWQYRAADYDGNGIINAVDASAVLTIYVNG